MKNVLLMGECMVELMPSTPDAFHRSFAGDVYNTAVYLKRFFPNLEAQLLSAVGGDNFSSDMLARFATENIGVDHVYRSQDKTAGLYSIQTDGAGERSFTYWRSDSAARQVMKYISEQEIEKLAQHDVFFFSGISLAVIQPADRKLFWLTLDKLKKAKVEIVFDPNYRARMWESQLQAKTEFEQAFTRADVVLPGIEDFTELYGFTTHQSVCEFLALFKITEIVVKNGAESINCLINGEEFVFDIEPVSNVIDTTSAGDSFNGVYLGARINGQSVEQSVELASATAAFVIQHRGAIVDKEQFKYFLKKYENRLNH